MSLDQDTAWFDQNRATIASQYPNMYVIVKDKAVIGAYPDYASAYTAGTQRYGTQPFLVKQATMTQRVENIAYNYRGRMGAAPGLSDDITWFEQNRAQLSQQYPNMYLLVKDKAVVGSYPDYASAYTAGTQKYGTQPFLVRQATPSQRVERVTLDYRIGMGRDQRPFLGQVPIAPDQSQQQQPASTGNPVDDLRQNGALVTVVIGVPAAYAQQLQASGQTPPPPQTVKAMIDTGASISTVSDAVAQAAGLQQVGSVPLGGVGGMSTRPIYSASFGVPDYNVKVDPIEIASVTIPVGGFDVLLGRDVLRAMELDYKGAQGVFALTQTAATPEAAAPAAGGPTVPGQPQPLPPPAAPGLSPWIWAGVGVGGVALIGGVLWLTLGRKKK